MPDQESHPPSPARKKYRYTPWSMIGGPFGLGFGLSLGKLLGESLEWGKVATVTAECVIAATFSLAFAVAVNFFFGKEVEVMDKRRPASGRPAWDNGSTVDGQFRARG